MLQLCECVLNEETKWRNNELSKQKLEQKNKNNIRTKKDVAYWIIKK